MEDIMRKDELDKKFLQSYVYTKKGNYFVSTIYRMSSAMMSPSPWYYETLGWTLKDKDEKDRLFIQEASNFPEGAIKNHYEQCQKLILADNKK